MLEYLRNLSRWKKSVLAIGVLVAVAQMAVIAERRTRQFNDLDVQREFGRRLLAREPIYEGDLCFNYMPVSALYYAPMAIVPSPVASVLRSLVALVCLGFTLHWMAKMIAPFCRPGAFDAFTIGALAVLLTSHYILRDLDDGGPHLIYLAMVVGGVYCVWQGRQKWGAAWFGLAIALKMTPGLLVPFFCWKRQWRLAAYTSVATAAWIVSPALWMGPSAWFDAQQQWNRIAFSVFTGAESHVRDENEMRVQNQALKPAILRYLEAYPAGHPLKLDHAWDVPLLKLDEKTASRIATFVMVGLLGGVAWWSRKRYTDARDPRWLIEIAAVLQLVLLFSPLTWLQHVAMILPAVYLVVARDRGVLPLGRSAKAAIWVFAILSLALNRELLGKQNYLLLLSLHSHTLCQLIVLGLLMSAWRASGRQPDVHARNNSARGADAPTLADKSKRAA
jgi:hypothetical protein